MRDGADTAGTSGRGTARNTCRPDFPAHHDDLGSLSYALSSLPVDLARRAGRGVRTHEGDEEHDEDHERNEDDERHEDE
ncbi:hypothetical protein GCM10009601_48800 [Streptomyces thermospinosisporus]|uniref:Uncharacterized protein n=1 Tax=Streptomyces thermospinosisporus TaxID=161482 RepID=A0ABP4JUQ5_9ACTN